MRVASRLAGPILRVEVHPRDLSSASHMLALEDVIGRAVRTRECVTYDDLAADSLSATAAGALLCV